MEEEQEHHKHEEHHGPSKKEDTVTITKTKLWQIVSGKLGWIDAIEQNRIHIQYGENKFREFLALMDE